MRKDRLGGLINGLLAACRYFDGVMHVLYDLHGALIHFFVFLTLNVCSSSRSGSKQSWSQERKDFGKIKQSRMSHFRFEAHYFKVPSLGPFLIWAQISIGKIILGEYPAKQEIYVK